MCHRWKWKCIEMGKKSILLLSTKLKWQISNNPRLERLMNIQMSVYTHPYLYWYVPLSLWSGIKTPHKQTRLFRERNSKICEQPCFICSRTWNLTTGGMGVQMRRHANKIINRAPIKTLDHKYYLVGKEQSVNKVPFQWGVKQKN